MVSLFHEYLNKCGGNYNRVQHQLLCINSYLTSNKSHIFGKKKTQIR